MQGNIGNLPEPIPTVFEQYAKNILKIYQMDANIVQNVDNKKARSVRAC